MFPECHIKYVLITTNQYPLFILRRGCAHAKAGGCSRHNLHGVDLLQIGHGLAAKGLHQYIRTHDGLFGRLTQGRRAALGDDAPDILTGAIHQGQQADASAASGLAKDGHIVRIAAEARDVLMHPFEGHQDAVTSFSFRRSTPPSARCS